MRLRTPALPVRRAALPVALALALAAGCGGGSSTAPTAAPTGDGVPVVTVSDDACRLSVDTVTAGVTDLRVESTAHAGASVTVTATSGPGARPVARLDGLAPGTSRAWRVTLPGGDYQVTCATAGQAPHTTTLSADGEG